MLTQRSSEVCYRFEVILNIKSNTVMAVTSLIYKKVKLYSPHFSYHVRNNYFKKNPNCNQRVAMNVTRCWCAKQSIDTMDQ